MSWIPNFKKDVICFSWLYFGERSVTQPLAVAADRHGHTGNACSLQLGRLVDGAPGIQENKTANVQSGITSWPRSDDGSWPRTLHAAAATAACSQSRLKKEEENNSAQITPRLIELPQLFGMFGYCLCLHEIHDTQHHNEYHINN